MLVDITDRQLLIINALVSGWLDSDRMPLPGCISYNELCEWLVSIGANNPKDKIYERLNEIRKFYENRI